jgi:hypothetical protein
MEEILRKMRDISRINERILEDRKFEKLGEKLGEICI